MRCGSQFERELIQCTKYVDLKRHEDEYVQF